MKYSFNEKELLDLFIDANNDLRPMYAKPYENRNSLNS